MTTGNVLYLLMALGMFITFALVLAYESWQQSRLGPDVVSELNVHQAPRSAAVA